MPPRTLLKRLATPIAVLALLALPTAALAEGDLDLLTNAGVAPNVVLYLDTSGTMLLHAFDDDFNSKKIYPPTCWAWRFGRGVAPDWFALPKTKMRTGTSGLADDFPPPAVRVDPVGLQ